MPSNVLSFNGQIKGKFMRLVLAQSVVAFAPDPLQHTLLRHAVLNSLKPGTRRCARHLKFTCLQELFCPFRI